MLGRCGLVVLGLGQDADFPEFFIELCHEGLNTGLDRTEEVITQLLPFGSRRAEKRTAGKDQVAATVVEGFIHQEVFLLGTDGRRDACGIETAEELQDPDGLFIQGFHGAKQGCFLVQRFTAVRTVGGGDAENMFLDKGIGSRIPGGIPTGFEGGTQAAGRQGGSIRLAADKFLPGEFLDDLSVLGRGDERVMLLGGDRIQRLEPVGVMRRPALDCPILHCIGDNAGYLGIQAAPVVNGFVQGAVGFLRQSLAHDGIIEYIDAEILIHKAHLTFRLSQKHGITQFRLKNEACQEFLLSTTKRCTLKEQRSFCVSDKIAGGFRACGHGQDFPIAPDLRTGCCYMAIIPGRSARKRMCTAAVVTARAPLASTPDLRRMVILYEHRKRTDYGSGKENR